MDPPSDSAFTPEESLLQHTIQLCEQSNKQALLQHLKLHQSAFLKRIAENQQKQQQQQSSGSLKRTAQKSAPGGGTSRGTTGATSALNSYVDRHPRVLKRVAQSQTQQPLPLPPESSVVGRSNKTKLAKCLNPLGRLPPPPKASSAVPISVASFKVGPSATATVTAAAANTVAAPLKAQRPNKALPSTTGGEGVSDGLDSNAIDGDPLSGGVGGDTDFRSTSNLTYPSTGNGDPTLDEPAEGFGIEFPLPDFFDITSKRLTHMLAQYGKKLGEAQLNQVDILSLALVEADEVSSKASGSGHYQDSSYSSGFSPTSSGLNETLDTEGSRHRSGKPRDSTASNSQSNRRKSSGASSTSGSDRSRSRSRSSSRSRSRSHSRSHSSSRSTDSDSSASHSSHSSYRKPRAGKKGEHKHTKGRGSHDHVDIDDKSAGAKGEDESSFSQSGGRVKVDLR